MKLHFSPILTIDVGRSGSLVIIVIRELSISLSDDGDGTTFIVIRVTLVESLSPAHQTIAQEVIEKCLPYSGNSRRIGITGVPGAGKSTSIDAFGLHVLKDGGKLAVLAIDPSSERTKGSILGDKTAQFLVNGLKHPVTGLLTAFLLKISVFFNEIEVTVNHFPYFFDAEVIISGIAEHFRHPPR